MPVVSSGPNRFFDPARGGGALLDRGVYAISFAVWFFGNPLAVSAMVYRGESGVDESTTALLKFASGRLATLAASLGAYTSNEIVIAGSTGRLRLHAPMVRSERISVERAPVLVAGESKSDLDPRSPTERARRLLARTRAYMPDGLRGSTVLRRPVEGYGYGYEAAEVVRCLREKLSESPIMPLAETRTVAAVVEELAATTRK
jgi:predicted dehydrogenase